MISHTERQAHGLVYQDYIINKFQITEATSYTSEWDGFLNETPVSIKVQQQGSDIELADYFRNANKMEDFYLFVGFWEGAKTNIVNEHILFIPNADYKLLFDEEFSYKFKHLLDNITNSYADDAKWKKQRTELQKEWKEKTSNLIRPRFKRDHKTQKRIQCAINFQDFFAHFVPLYSIQEEDLLNAKRNNQK